MKQFVIAALMSSTQAAACVDAYTTLADAELAQAKADQVAADGKLEKVKVLVTDQLKSQIKMKELQTPVDQVVAPFVVNNNAAVAAHTAAKKAYVLANEAYGAEQTIDLGDTTQMQLWAIEGANPVTMQFKVKKTDEGAIKTLATVTTKNAKEKCKLALDDLKSLLVKQEAELVRRKAQDKLYDTATTNAANAQKVYLKAKNKDARMKVAVALAEAAVVSWTDGAYNVAKGKDATKTTALIDALFAHADNKFTDSDGVVSDALAKSDFTLVSAWREAQKHASAYKTASLDPKEQAVTNAYGEVTGIKATEKEKYIYNTVYVPKCGKLDAVADSMTCLPGDGSLEQLVANFKTARPLLLKDAAMVTAQTNLATEYDAYRKLVNTEDYAKQAMDRQLTVYADAMAAADTAENKDVKSKTYLVNSQKAVANGEKDVADTNALITAKTAELARLTNTETVALHINQLTKDKFATLQAARDDANDLQIRLAKQELLAKTALDRANAKLAIYKIQFDGADKMHKAEVASEELATKMAAAAKDKVEACTKKVAMALENCKGVKYALAQKTYGEWDKKQEADKDTAKQVAEAYAPKYKAKDDGSAGTRCEYPPPEADGTQKPRTKCKEDEANPMCCGSANKYLRDGTRLTVETCQTAKGTHYYDFYPKLKEGALVEPQPEQWRFYCIEGAQKLAAAMAASIGAVYFMA